MFHLYKGILTWLLYGKGQCFTKMFSIYPGKYINIHNKFQIQPLMKEVFITGEYGWKLNK